MLKRSKGIAFVLLGCALLITASVWCFYNVVEDKTAGEQAAKILSEFNNQKSSNDNTQVITINGNDFCGKVIIDKLSVELPVYNDWNYAKLKSAPCRYMGSIDTNDIIIAAHNYKSHFGKLNKLQLGDEIAFTNAYGETHKYEVCKIGILDGTAVSDMQSGDWDFTLFTCTKGGEQRVTVRCKRK